MLGPFEARYMGNPITRQAWGRPKSLAIAKFLIAHRGESVSLGLISELFYEGAPVDRIRSNLRGRISEIRRALWPDRTHPDYENGLQFISTSGFRFDPQEPCWIDVEWFDRYIESANEHYRQEMWQLALEDFTRANALYRGDFLVDDLDEPWTYEMRERLRTAYQSSLTQTAECHIRLGQYRQAVAVARRAQELDPLNEEAYRLQIVAYGHIPDQVAALNVYHELLAALQELSVEPDPEITELIGRIKKGPLKRSAPSPRHNLVQQLTPFFGREKELATLREQLSDPQTRVVTLLGPGGIGKTRLAVEAGRQLAQTFRDGVVYVPVSEYYSAQGLAAGIAQTLGFAVNRPNSGVSELAGFLANKQMLLIIDAAEHARDAWPLFDTLIRAPEVKLLVTSRLRLHLPGEYIIDVEGLPYLADSGDSSDSGGSGDSGAPDASAHSADTGARGDPGASADSADSAASIRSSGGPGGGSDCGPGGAGFSESKFSDSKRVRKAPSVESTPAYRLFVDRYARLRPRFRPTPEDSEAIASICRSVEGMPLAIEMAASWGRVLSCREIAGRVASPETLTGTVDGQNQGMESVFSFSWRMLTEVEQRAALRLSTFAGSLSRSAAEFVADCPASTIMSLGDKSFVQWDAQGRFRVHEVIRAFLRRNLAADPDAEARAFQAHAWYFASLLDGDMAAGIDQKQIRELRHDLPNIQQAWRRWVSHMEADALQRTLRSLVQVHESLDQWAVLTELLEAAAARVQERLQPVLEAMESLSGRGKTSAVTGETALDKGQSPAHVGEPLTETDMRERHPEEIDPAGLTRTRLMVLCAALFTQLAYVAMRLGDLPRAEVALRDAKKMIDALHWEESVAPADGTADGLTNGTKNGSNPTYPDPAFVDAAYVSRAKAHTEAMHRMISGWFSYERGDAARAKPLLSAAAEELQSLGDPWHQASAISLLATLARTSGDLEHSRHLYEECLEIHQRLGDPRAIAGDLLNLGSVYGTLQKYDEAERYFAEARRYAEEGNHRLLLFYIIGNSGFLAYRRSRLAQAEALCLEALDLAVDLGHKVGMANVAYYLALIALDRQQPERALPYLRQALDQTLHTQTVQVMLQTLHGYARYFVLIGDYEQAAALLRFVLTQPGYPQAARKRSEEVLASVVSRLTAPQIANAERKATTQSLDDFVAELRSITGALGTTP